MTKMVPQSTENIKELHSQLNAVMNTPVGVSKVMAKIDKKLTPILKNLLIQQGKLAFKSLLDWLIHPRRIVEEFIYVLGPLIHSIKRKYAPCIYRNKGTRLSDLEEEEEEGEYVPWCFKNIKDNRDMIYVGLAALEAISVKCPVLEGNWEIAVWLTIRIMYCDNPNLRPIVSDRLSTWIINVIGDADICPNAHLRIELLELLRMIRIGSHNRTQAFNVVMDACSNISYDYLRRNDNGCSGCFDRSTACAHVNFYYGFDSESEYDFNLSNDNPARKDNQFKYNNGCSKICFGEIVIIFEHILKDDKLIIIDDLLKKFSEKLVDKMDNVNSLRMSSIIHDVTYNCGVNPNKYTEPRELQSLIALLNTTAKFAQEESHKVEHEMYTYQLGQRKDNIMNMFRILINKLKICYKIPQLICPTAWFIINVIEFVFTSDFYRDTDVNESYDPIDDTSIPRIEHGLQELLLGSNRNTIDDSPIGQELLSRYDSRLKRLKELCGDFENFPTIHSLMKHV